MCRQRESELGWTGACLYWGFFVECFGARSECSMKTKISKEFCKLKYVLTYFGRTCKRNWSLGIAASEIMTWLALLGDRSSISLLANPGLLSWSFVWVYLVC